MIYLSVKDTFIRELEKSFDKKLQVAKRIRVISDLQMFRPKEDPFVWGEKKGKVPEHLMIYFDGVHILTFNETESIPKVMLKFWKGFREAYKVGSIKLTPPWMIEQVKTPTESDIQIERLSKIEAGTKERKIAKAIVKSMINKKVK
jgi:hypothetical protein